MAKSKAKVRKLPPQVADAVRRVIRPQVEVSGLYLEEIKLTSDGGQAVVRVVLDLPEDERGSLGSDRLDDAARAISKALDDDDVVPGAYNLEVSSPGVSRPLTEPRHFKRARGRMIEAQRKTGAPIRGRLTDVITENDECLLIFEKGDRIPLKDVSKGKVKVELNNVAENGDPRVGGSDGN